MTLDEIKETYFGDPEDFISFIEEHCMYELFETGSEVLDLYNFKTKCMNEVVISISFKKAEYGRA